jgi:hypothetical protein
MLAEKRNKLLLAIGIIIALVLVMVAFLIFKSDKPTPNKKVANTIVVKDDHVGLVINRDASLRTKPADKEMVKEIGQLWDFRQPANSQQEFAIDANYEQGESLKKLTGYTKQSLRDSVINNVNLQLPKQYPSYEEVTQRNLTVNGVEANETIFEYLVSGVKVRQRLLLLFKNSSTAVYIRAQAPAEDFTKVNKRYFEPIFSSAKFE